MSNLPKNDGKQLTEAHKISKKKFKTIAQQRKSLFDAVYVETIERIEADFLKLNGPLQYFKNGFCLKWMAFTCE